MRKTTPLVIIFLFGLVSLASGQFIETTPDSLKNLGLHLGDADWGDYDNDGDLDLLVIGRSLNNQPTTSLFENQSGTLVEKTIGLPGVSSGSCDWGDFDNDGDLDILLMGLSSSRVLMQIYVNTNGTFTLLESSVSQLPQLYLGESRWADFNNDGLLDIVCTGYLNSDTANPGVFQSMGDGSFVRRFTLTQTQNGKLDVGDFDNDGDTDIVVTGPNIMVYRNDGNWVFSLARNTLSSIITGDVMWADMDNDGRLDLVASGSINGSEVLTSTVYQNQGTTFHALKNSVSISGANHSGSVYTGAAMGDYNNDGASDLIVSTPLLKLYNNNGHGDLTDSNLSLPSVNANGSFALRWADYDQDHDLDFYSESILARNIGTTVNTPPNPPTLIEIDSVYNSTVYFHWNSGSDNETAADGLTYQIYVGTQSQQQDIVNSNSFLSDGKRKLAEPGIVKGKNWKVNLPGGNYYFGVQSIDPAFEGSTFSPEINVLVIGIEGQGSCAGYNSSYVAKPFGAYTWSVKGGTVISGQGTDSVVIRWDVAGNGIIKVSNSNGDKNTLVVAIDKKPATVIIGDNTVCTNINEYNVSDSLSYTVTWSVPSGGSIYVASGKVADIRWDVPGAHQLIAQAFSKNGACFSHDTLLVNVDQSPSVPTISGLQNTCVFQKDKYISDASSPTWKATNGTIVADYGQSIKVVWSNFQNGSSYQVGTVYAIQGSEHGYCTATGSLKVEINKGPAPTDLDEFQVCRGKVVKFNTVVQSPVWVVTNGTIVADSVQSIEVLWSSQGTGSVILTEVLTTTCPGYAYLPVKIFSYPDQPIITRSINQLSSSPSPTGVYYWYINDELISTGINQSMKIKKLGNYRVEIFNGPGCGSISDVFVVDVITDISPEDTPLTISPNPSNERIVLQMTNSNLGEYQIQIYSVLNTMVKQIAVTKNEFLLQQELEITDLNSGLYILTLSNGRESYTVKFIKI